MEFQAGKPSTHQRNTSHRNSVRSTRAIFVIAALSIYTLAFHFSPTLSASDFIWRPESITLTVHFRDTKKQTGQYILLENQLREGETGWTMSKMDIPDSWALRGLHMQGQTMTFTIQTGETFCLAPPQLNKLDFELLNGGKKSQQEIESLWRKYAKAPSKD